MENDEDSAMDELLKKKKKKLPKMNLDDYQTKPKENTEKVKDEEDDEDDNDDDQAILDDPKAGQMAQPLWILPLYSKLDPKEQAKVFQSAPEGHRMCVIGKKQFLYFSKESKNHKLLFF